MTKRTNETSNSRNDLLKEEYGLGNHVWLAILFILSITFGLMVGDRIF